MTSSRGPSLLLRFDFGSGVGWGHASRCVALAEAWHAGGGSVAYEARELVEPWPARFAAAGATVLGDDAATRGFDVVLLDGYGFDCELQQSAHDAARVVAVIDDFGRIGEYQADLIIDTNLGASPDNYHRAKPGTRLLLGPTYALLRAVFAEARQNHVDRSDGDGVLVMLGGSPPAWASELIGTATHDGHLAGMRVEALIDAEDVTGPMGRASLAISAAGTTTWELLCVGVPSVLVPIADNQQPVADAIEALDLAEVLRPPASTADLARAVERLASDPRRRADLSERGRNLVDGAGARRVVAHLRSLLIRARSATLDDAELLWEWANDPVARDNSFNPEPIPWDDHVEWLTARLRDESTRLFVLEVDGLPVGQVRFDRTDPHDYIVSISIGADSRGHGWGPAAILAATMQLTAETTDVQRILASVKVSNTASQRSFELVGFVQEGDGSADGDGWHQYALTVQRPSLLGRSLAGSAWTI